MVTIALLARCATRNPAPQFWILALKPARLSTHPYGPRLFQSTLAKPHFHSKINVFLKKASYGNQSTGNFLHHAYISNRSWKVISTGNWLNKQRQWKSLSSKKKLYIHQSSQIARVEVAVIYTKRTLGDKQAGPGNAPKFKREGSILTQGNNCWICVEYMNEFDTRLVFSIS